MRCQAAFRQELKVVVQVGWLFRDLGWPSVPDCFQTGAENGGAGRLAG